MSSLTLLSDEPKYIIQNRCLKEMLTKCIEFKRILDHIFSDRRLKHIAALNDYELHFLKFRNVYETYRNAFSDQLEISIDRIDDVHLTSCGDSRCPFPECQKPKTFLLHDTEENGEDMENTWSLSSPNDDQLSTENQDKVDQKGYNGDESNSEESNDVTYSCDDSNGKDKETNVKNQETHSNEDDSMIQFASKILEKVSENNINPSEKSILHIDSKKDVNESNEPIESQNVANVSSVSDNQPLNELNETVVKSEHENSKPLAVLNHDESKERLQIEKNNEGITNENVNDQSSEYGVNSDHLNYCNRLLDDSSEQSSPLTTNIEASSEPKINQQSEKYVKMEIDNSLPPLLPNTTSKEDKIDDPSPEKRLKLENKAELSLKELDLLNSSQSISTTLTLSPQPTLSNEKKTVTLNIMPSVSKNVNIIGMSTEGNELKSEKLTQSTELKTENLNETNTIPSGSIRSVQPTETLTRCKVLDCKKQFAHPSEATEHYKNHGKLYKCSMSHPLCLRIQ
ncbi:hypothetical protein BLOT_005216 [Blomia tropicalis]|nr:hypothetical protein BLOT_005216 [Blomia tropicalis]